MTGPGILYGLSPAVVKDRVAQAHGLVRGQIDYTPEVRNKLYNELFPEAVLGGLGNGRNVIAEGPFTWGKDIIAFVEIIRKEFSSLYVNIITLVVDDAQRKTYVSTGRRDINLENRPTVGFEQTSVPDDAFEAEYDDTPDLAQLDNIGIFEVENNGSSDRAVEEIIKIIQK